MLNKDQCAAFDIENKFDDYGVTFLVGDCFVVMNIEIRAPWPYAYTYILFCRSAHIIASPKFWNHQAQVEGSYRVPCY
jgi:hypothetical protein